jgi:hypothetical protein
LVIARVRGSWYVISVLISQARIFCQQAVTIAGSLTRGGALAFVSDLPKSDVERLLALAEEGTR